MNATVIRPLVDQYYKLQDVSIVYCLMVNRLQFLKEHATALHHQSVNATRAILCELVANRVLRRFSENNPGTQGLLLLAHILVAGFDPFQGAPEDVIKENDPAHHWSMQTTGGYLRRLPTLEIAIVSESKALLSSSACQRVVNAIYEGRVVYTPSSFIDILPDHYKSKPISLYDPRKAPLLNQYRLIVPRTRNILEVGQFIVLLVLYVLVMSNRDAQAFSTVELVFCLYTAGWVLDQVASILEHGWSVYTQNLWSFLDVTFAIIYGIYLVLRILGLRVGSFDTGHQAMDVLAIGAPFLIPRLAFNLMSENILFLSLRSMMADFALLTALAVWCFAGFLLSMTWLGDGDHEAGPITISKWMLWIWFGLDGTGIPRSVDFHWLLGPMLMVTFAFLGNTLFLTILVSMLTNTFAGIVSNASAEIQYRRAVLTFEGVKSDAIFAYQPPFNIAALVFILPLKFIVSPRWFHKINVAVVRFLNAPLLLIIGYWERRALWAGFRKNTFMSRRQRGMLGFMNVSRSFSLHGDIQAVFDSAPPQPTQDEISDVDDLDNQEPDSAGTGPDQPPTLSRTNSSMSRPKSRRDSMAPFGGLKEQLRDLLREGAESESDSGSEADTRLNKLEESIQRIETMLGALVQNQVKDDDSKLAQL